MNPSRVGILIWKDLLYGSKLFLIVPIVTPIVTSLFVSLLFGTLFLQKPKLGIVDGGTSQIVPKIAESDLIASREFGSAPKLKKAVKAGAVDIGVVLPQDFDRSVISGERTEVIAYIWGESLIKNRAMVGAFLAKQIREMAGQRPPVDIVAADFGDDEGISWADRLIPLVALIAIFMGGVMLPATSLVDEKQKQTLKALVITPMSLMEVYLAKGILGSILSFLMGVIILFLNQAFGAQPSLLLFVLGLGAILAASIGVLLATFMNDINTLSSTMKFIGLILYAPALIYMFPQIPAWVGKVFPTYYLMAPLLEISQKNSRWTDISLDVLFLVGIILCLWFVMVLKTKMFKHIEV